jgi:Na+(H+)/acetate symporter ActP
MTRKEIAVEFVIPTAFAVALGLVLGLVLSASSFFS